MRTAVFLLTIFGLSCARPAGSPMTEREVQAVKSQVEETLRHTYDMSKPGLAERMVALYADSGRVVSAVGGSVETSRDSLVAGIRYFWENVGVNMRQPRWVWDSFYVDVLSPTSAAVTATYHIPHLNPRNEPHVLGGAMTLVMVKRRGRWVVVQEHLSDLPQIQTAQANENNHENH